MKLSYTQNCVKRGEIETAISILQLQDRTGLESYPICLKEAKNAEAFDKLAKAFNRLGVDESQTHEIWLSLKPYKVIPDWTTRPASFFVHLFIEDYNLQEAYSNVSDIFVTQKSRRLLLAWYKRRKLADNPTRFSDREDSYDSYEELEFDYLYNIGPTARRMQREQRAATRRCLNLSSEDDGYWS